MNKSESQTAAWEWLNEHGEAVRAALDDPQLDEGLRRLARDALVVVQKVMRGEPDVQRNMAARLKAALAIIGHVHALPKQTVEHQGLVDFKFISAFALPPPVEVLPEPPKALPPVVRKNAQRAVPASAPTTPGEK